MHPTVNDVKIRPFKFVRERAFMNVMNTINSFTQAIFNEVVQTIKPYTYVLYGEPIPMQRCRHGRKEWDIQAQKKLHASFKLAQIHNERNLLKGPLHLDISFYFSLPKKNSGKLKDSFCCASPEISKLIKFIEEVGTGVVFSDECTITSVASRKRYDNVPRTEFIIEEIKNEKKENNS